MSDSSMSLDPDKIPQVSPLEPLEPESQGTALDRLISQAIERDLDVDKLERLLAMRATHEAEVARRAYYEAMASFQRDCPAIAKKKKADRYFYAPLSDIVAQTKALEADCGLSHRFETTPRDDGGIDVLCVVTHTLGHSESNPCPVPATKGQGTNSAQNIGIMTTYGMRYSFLGAFGITTADEDMDARLPEPTDELIDADGLELLRTIMTEVGADEAAIRTWAKVENLEAMPLRALPKALGILHRKREQNDG